MKKGKNPKGIPSDLLDAPLPAELSPFTSPKKIVLPIETSWGKLSPLVGPGDEVILNQILAQDDNGLIPPVYAPVFGRVKELRNWITSTGKESPCIVLDVQESSTPTSKSEGLENISLKDLSSEEIFHKIHDAGIVEVDNYAWPLAWRVAKPGITPNVSTQGEDNLSKPIEFLIINAMDRQPGSSLRSAMLKNSGEILQSAISLLKKVSGAQHTILTVWENQDLKESLQSKLGRAEVQIKSCPIIYPLALEPLLVQYVTGREVPQPSGDSRAVEACVVDIVATIQAYRAILSNSPVTHTPVQFMSYGNGWNHQITVPIGSLLEETISALPSQPQGISKIIMGGMFLGSAIHTLQVPISGNVDVIHLQTSDEITTTENKPCINCGKCVDICPMGLMPNDLSKFCEYEQFDSAEKNFLFHCIECGLCSFVCPAKRPMVHLIRFGKNEILKAKEV